MIARRSVAFLMTASGLSLSIAFATCLVGIHQANIVLTANRAKVALVGCGLLLIASVVLVQLGNVLARQIDTGRRLTMFLHATGRSSVLIVYWALACTALTSPLVPLVMSLVGILLLSCCVTRNQLNSAFSIESAHRWEFRVQWIGAIILLFTPLYQDHTGAWASETLSWIVLIATALSGIIAVRQFIRMTAASTDGT